MRVKMILPALTEATSPFFRPIKYSLFPPLGLATLAGYLGPDDEVTLTDEHVQKVDLSDEPDLVVNGSFVFGMDQDDPSVFDRTVEWAVAQGIETATFHILTPYPGTRLYDRMVKAGRMLHSDWDRYDTRRVVFKPARMTAQQLEDGYWRAYRDFYRWGSIMRGASTKPTLRGKARHAAYAGGWKKFEPAWDLVIRAKKAGRALPFLESILGGFGSRPAR